MAGLKRSAETQLTKDNADDDEDVMEIPAPEGFKKADMSILASRPMKGLPRRSHPIATTLGAPSSSNFDFGPSSRDFGTPTSPFTFGPSLNGSESATTQPVMKSSGFKFSIPAVSSSATETTKTLANIFNSVSQPIQPPKLNGTRSTPSEEKLSVPAKDDTKSKSDADYDLELKYYASLRGLNCSFKDQIEGILEENELYDLSVYFDQYREYRADVEKERTERWEPERSPVVNGTSSSSLSSPKAVSVPAQTMPLSMPTPPKAFAGFPAPTSSSSSSSAPPTGGFKPNFAAMPSSTTPSAFTFASSKTAEKGDEDKGKSTTAGSSGIDSKPSPFGIPVAGPSKPSPFGTASSGSSPFGLTGTPAADKPATPFGSGSGFGSTSTMGRSSSFTAPIAGASNPFGSSSAGSSTLLPAFGSTGPGSSGFSFGGGLKPSQSFGGSSTNMFGSKPAYEESKQSSEVTSSEPVASSSKATSSFASTSGSSGFSFGSSSATTASSSKDVASTSAKPSAPASVASGEESRGETPASGEGGEAPATTEMAQPKKVLGENIHDLEGEGEEDEETLFTVRGKIFRFGKKDEKASWNEVGVGMIRIKKKKTDCAHVRLLSRNTTTGKIMMNFKLYSGIKVTQTKTILNFVGHDETGGGVTYRVRVKDEDSATEFRDAIESAAAALEA